jgi:hypothetical protein
VVNRRCRRAPSPSRPILRDWLAAAPKAKGSIKLDIEIGPQSFL